MYAPLSPQLLSATYITLNSVKQDVRKTCTNIINRGNSGSIKHIRL